MQQKNKTRTLVQKSGAEGMLDSKANRSTGLINSTVWLEQMRDLFEDHA